MFASSGPIVCGVPALYQRSLTLEYILLQMAAQEILKRTPAADES